MLNDNKIRGLVIGYSRVSTEQQAQSGGSLTAQVEEIRGWVWRKGHPMTMIYQDVGSAMGTMLPELEQAFREAKALGASIVVTGPDRLSRNVAQTREAIRKFGVEIISIKHGGKISFNKLLSEVKRLRPKERRMGSIRRRAWQR